MMEVYLNCNYLLFPSLYLSLECFELDVKTTAFIFGDYIHTPTADKMSWNTYM